jgi:hypothetical protein
MRGGVRSGGHEAPAGAAPAVASAVSRGSPRGPQSIQGINVFTCRNQSCGAQWEQSDVVIKNEGQGLLFRCPMCGARNYVERFDADDGTVVYEQIEGRPY